MELSFLVSLTLYTDVCLKHFKIHNTLKIIIMKNLLIKVLRALFLPLIISAGISIYGRNFYKIPAFYKYCKSVLLSN